MSFSSENGTPDAEGVLPASSPKSKPKRKRKPRLNRKPKPRITRKHKPSGRTVGTKASGLREKAWRTIRHLRQFTLNDLLDINATGSEKDAPSNLFKYLDKLEQCGVLVRLDRRASDANKSRGFVVWRLERDLGWDAPVWRNVQKVLWNPNTNSAVDLPAVNSDTDTATPGQGSAV